jgi:hypothetical protein
MAVDAPPTLLGSECEYMRCAACGAEAILMTVVRDDTMAVLGFEHHTFRCSGCRNVERCLVFIRHGRETAAESLPMDLAPPIVPASPAPASPVQGVRVAGFLRRAVAKLPVRKP